MGEHADDLADFEWERESARKAHLAGLNCGGAEYCPICAKEEAEEMDRAQARFDWDYDD